MTYFTGASVRVTLYVSSQSIYTNMYRAHATITLGWSANVDVTVANGSWTNDCDTVLNCNGNAHVDQLMSTTLDGYDVASVHRFKDLKN